MQAFYSLLSETIHHHPLSGWSVMGAQHLLASTGDMLRGFARAGSTAGGIHVSAKCYSQNLRVLEELSREGIRIEAMRPHGTHEMHLAHHDAQLDRSIEGLDQLLGDGKILIVDDGGRVINKINNLVLQRSELRGRIVAVEQTRKGIIELAGSELAIPVINVAESHAKLRYESPIIGRMVVNKTLAKLAKLRRAGYEPGRRVLLLGYGSVQRSVARYLKKAGYAVAVYDPKWVKNGAAVPAPGVEVFADRSQALETGSIVIAATGVEALRERDLALLPDGAVLISAGSADTEFCPGAKRFNDPETRVVGGEYIQSVFCGRRIHLGSVQNHNHRDRVVCLRDKHVLLANNGFPINFDGGVHSAPPRYIQLTLGLLHLGALQATVTEIPGLHDLMPATQRKWVRRVQTELKRNGSGSLLAPTLPVLGA